MKCLQILLLSALTSLCAMPPAQAEKQQCNCTCQCETSPAPTSLGVKTVAIPKPPPPTVVEAKDGELDLRTLGDADATVEVTYPEIADGHTVGLYWTSDIQQYRAPVQTVSGGATRVTFMIPNAKVAIDLGRSPVLTASVGVNNDPIVISQPQTIKVVQTNAPGELPPPTLPGSPDNQVDIGALPGDLTVSVHYPTMSQGQIVRVLWKGATSYETPLRITPDSNPLLFSIPKDSVFASLNKPVNLSYEASLDGQPAKSSDPALLTVSLLTLPDSPVVPSAHGGQLDLIDARLQDLKVTITYPGISAGHTVGIRWAGEPPYDTPHPAIGDAPRPLEFSIPYAKVSQEKGKTVKVTASVGTGGARLALSPELPLAIVDSRPSGEQVAADLNTRYEDTRTTCDNNTPAYYCNGVMSRGTINSTYDPWDPSPTQITKGSISFTYLRRDASITDPYRDSGLLVLSQQEAINQGKQHDVVCSFPHDGWTDVARTNLGCGFSPLRNGPLAKLLSEHAALRNMLLRNDEIFDRLSTDTNTSQLLESNPELAALLRQYPQVPGLLRDNLKVLGKRTPADLSTADPSTCSTVGVTDLPTWYDYTKGFTRGLDQCSLSSQEPGQFALSIKARQQPVAIFSDWNEILIKVWPAQVPARLPLEAFYYENANGLLEAQEYQRRYTARTGGLWLPIVKLDIARLAIGNPFSYAALDQAVQP